MQRPFAAYQGTEPYVFVCYAHDDAADVYGEITRLKDAGFNIWYDEGISPGSEWSAEIAEHIERCAVFLYFVSPRSVDREYCRKELNFAVEEARPILHVHLEPTDVPSALRLNLSHLQGILRFEHARPDYQTKLDDALRTALESPQALERPAARSTPIKKRRTPWMYGAAAAVVISALTAVLLLNGVTEPQPFDRSLVVEPTSTIGEGAGLSDFATALTEDLVARLARYQELRATPVSEEGDAPLSSSYSLRTSVQAQPVGAHVRAQLVRTGDGQTVWSEDFDEPTLQKASPRLATAIARFVRLQLLHDHQCESIRRRSKSADAAAYLCEALAEMSKFNQRAGQGDFELIRLNADKAIALDPNLVEAYVQRGIVYAMTGDGAAARSNVDAGLAIWPNDPGLLFHKGYHLDFRHDLDYDAAVATLTRAIEADPLHLNARIVHDGLGGVELHRGNLDAALRHFRRSITVFDADARTWSSYAAVLNMAGRPGEAIKAAEAGLELVSEGLYRYLLLISKADGYVELGNFELAESALDEALTLSSLPWESQMRPGASRIMVKLGRSEEVRGYLQGLQSMPNPRPVAMLNVQLALGNIDAAFDWMLKGIEQRNFRVLSAVRVRPGYAAMRSSPRWEEVESALAAQGR